MLPLLDSKPWFDAWLIISAPDSRSAMEDHSRNVPKNEDGFARELIFCR